MTQNSRMKTRFWAFLSGVLATCPAIAANEGVPTYYQTQYGQTANQAGYAQYADQGYTRYVGQSGQKQIVGTNTYTYQVPRQTVPDVTQIATGVMTTNGVAVPVQSEPATSVYAGYTRRFADFQFETGVNSVLEWDDMVFNEVTVGLHHNFSLRNFDLMAYAEYTHGWLDHGGLSMDYDLAPFDWAYPEYGIFTISMGGQSGTSQHLRLGFGARHIWDIGGWKLTPSIGYEIFKHDLKMFDHIYPNPGIYLPLMTADGQYVFGDTAGNYFSVPVYSNDIPDDWYQVCMSPEDIKVVSNTASGYYNGFGSLGESLVTKDYDSSMGYWPWGVGPGDCVIIGGDGPIIVEGTTHIYNTTWSGFYIGLEMEKQMTLKDKLRFYVQFGLPKYSSEGTWPNRTDWQQNPSFLDEGSNGAYSYLAEMEYNYKLSDRLQLSVKVDTNLFHVGRIGGELYIAEYGQFLYDEYGQPVLDDDGWPIWETVSAHTEQVNDSLNEATWQSFGLHVGVKYAF